MITHSPPVEAALQLAHEQWPRASVAERIIQLALLGAQTLATQRESERATWRAKVQAGAGLLTSTYGPGYLADIREGWPE